jgi:glycosyltransferase involved in cell wall biosynthesis
MSERFASRRPLRVLYSFPDGLGAPGVGTTAHRQVQGLIALGLEVSVICTSLQRELPGARSITTTLTAGGRRIPHRALGGGDRAYRYHDMRTAHALRGMADRIDVVHVWPRASLATARTARELGIPSIREVPNTHTAYAYEAAAHEAQVLGLEQPPGHSHTYDAARLRHEEAEFDAVDVLLCQSEFSRATFVARGIPAAKMAIHQNGADLDRFSPSVGVRPADKPLTILFAGRCEPRKGLHYALRAWVDSGAGDRGGRFLICGEYVEGYREVLAPWLTHPSVEDLGYVGDLSGLMREADAFILPSVEEGSALVTYEAQAAGCVLVVSDATGARCDHMETGLVHAARDVEALTAHIRLLEEEPMLLARLRGATLARRDQLTWARSVQEQADVYAAALAGGARPHAVAQA